MNIMATILECLGIDIVSDIDFEKTQDNSVSSDTDKKVQDVSVRKRSGSTRILRSKDLHSIKTRVKRSRSQEKCTTPQLFSVNKKEL